MTPAPAKIPFGRWAPLESPLAIEYPIEVLDEIRAVCRQAVAGSGPQPTGVLFGTRKDETLRILSWRPCPARPDEVARLLAEFRTDPDLLGLEPLGWFVLHARGDISLAAADLEVYGGCFGAPWQVALVLRPGRQATVRAGFFVRARDGSLRTESSYREFTLLTPHGSEPAEQPPPRLLSPSRRTFRWLWLAPGFLAIITAVVLLRSRSQSVLPSPPPAFAFRIAEGDGRLSLQWDGKAPVLEGARATLAIDDGKDHSDVPLDQAALRAGGMAFVRHSPDLQVRMTVYPAHGAPLAESARLVTGSRADPSPDAAELRRLTQENKKLREDASRESARAARAENLVRILQQRLK
ncbi:MAG: hypothetical protein M3O35_01780 [Acidobacteriota bacterium]|nr:hypothetical protein [Acidobacteriota bacterium]